MDSKICSSLPLSYRKRIKLYKIQYKKDVELPSFEVIYKTDRKIFSLISFLRYSVKEINTFINIKKAYINTTLFVMTCHLENYFGYEIRVRLVS